MKSTIRRLKIGYATEPPLFNPCFKSLPNQISACRYPGVIPTFYEELSSIFEVQFDFVHTLGFGNGHASENGTVFELIRKGRVDFTGPDYIFSRTRDIVAERSGQILSEYANMFMALEYSSEGFNIPQMLGSTISVLAYVAFAALGMLGSYYIRQLAHSKSMIWYTRISTATTVLFFVQAGIILNLYVSLLSVKCIEQDVKSPGLQNIYQLRDYLVDNQLKVVLSSPTSQKSKNIVDQLIRGTNKALRDKLMSSIVYGKTYSNLLKIVLGDPTKIGIANAVVLMSDTWLTQCERVTRLPHSSEMFSEMIEGFYFSKSSANPDLKWFQKIVEDNRAVISKLFNLHLHRGAVRKQNNLKCSNNWKAPQKYNISIETSWNTVFKTVWTYGLLTALFGFALEYLFARTSRVLPRVR